MATTVTREPHTRICMHFNFWDEIIKMSYREKLIGFLQHSHVHTHIYA